MDFKPVKQAVSAVHSGKYSPSHVATLRKAGNFMAANKSHPWHKSGALRSAMQKTQTVRKSVVAGIEDLSNLAEGLYLYGGVGQRMRSPYGPKYGRGQRMRPKFPPRILSAQNQKKVAMPISIRLKALEALKKQTKFPKKPLAAPASPTGIRDVRENMTREKLMTLLTERSTASKIARGIRDVHQQSGDPVFLTRAGAMVGAAIGSAVPKIKGHFAREDLKRSMRKHVAKGQAHGVKMPKGVQYLSNRDQVKAWTKGKGNVQSRIPLIGTPLKRMAYRSAINPMVPSAKKGWRGKIANMGYRPSNAAYVPASTKKGRAAIVGHAHMPKQVIKHEVGHARDLKGMTDKDLERHHKTTVVDTFRSYKKHPVYKSEVAAWKKSGVGAADKYRQRALKTYKHGLGAAKGATIGSIAGAVVGGAADIYGHLKREDIEEALVEMQMKKNPVTKAMLKEIFKKKGKKRVTNKAMLDAIFKQKQKKG